MNKPILTTEKKHRGKSKLLLLFYMLLILALLLTVSSYTWFSLNRTPRVSNLSMYVASRFGLELALDANSETWGSYLSYRDMVTETSPLRPVTWSERDQRFYAAVYGINGRLTGEWQPLSDERNANRNSEDGYYCIGTFYARTSEDVTVSLTSAMDVETGVSGAGTYLIGAPVWDEEQVAHKNAGKGAENAMRMGIRITYLDLDGNPLDKDPLFYIYEPNSDAHVNGSVGYIATPGIHGDASLVPQDRLITQTQSGWTETDPVENGKHIVTYGDFTSPTELFVLRADQKAQIQIYIWLEGQDVDCTNDIEQARIIANLQFVTERKDQPGLKPFE